MTLKRAIAVLLRPWIDGSVTFDEWCLACDVVLMAIAQDAATHTRNQRRSD